MKRPTILAALATALAASVVATAAPAAASSASINDLTATLNLDGADDNVTVSVVGGLLVHGQTTGGLNSALTGTAARRRPDRSRRRHAHRRRQRRQRRLAITVARQNNERQLAG